MCPAWPDTIRHDPARGDLARAPGRSSRLIRHPIVVACRSDRPGDARFSTEFHHERHRDARAESPRSRRFSEGNRDDPATSIPMEETDREHRSHFRAGLYRHPHLVRLIPDASHLPGPRNSGQGLCPGPASAGDRTRPTREPARRADLGPLRPGVDARWSSSSRCRQTSHAHLLLWQRDVYE